MRGYFRLAGWLAYLAAVILVLWGVQLIATMVFDLQVPGGRVLVLPFLLASFLLYELAMLNIAMLVRRSGRFAFARRFNLLWLLPLLLIALFVVLNIFLPEEGMIGFAIVTAAFLGYAVFMGDSGFRLWHGAPAVGLRNVGLFVFLAAIAYGLQAAAALIGAAVSNAAFSPIVFWIMIVGGACVALMQAALGVHLINVARSTPNPSG